MFLVVFLVLLEWQWFGRLNIFSDFLAGSGEISMAMDSPRKEWPFHTNGHHLLAFVPHVHHESIWWGWHKTWLGVTTEW